MSNKATAAAFGRMFPFFLASPRTGQIVMLAGPDEPDRDTFALVWLARHFPLPKFAGISIEPSRTGLVPATNIVVLGRTEVLTGDDDGPSFHKPPLLNPKLRERLAPLRERCALRFERRADALGLLNIRTGKFFAGCTRDIDGLRVDYAVIRYHLDPRFGTTLTLEGCHSLGTFGAVKLVTSGSFLVQLWEQLDKRGGALPQFPVEILLGARFDPQLTEGIYTPETVVPEPLAVMCGGTHLLDWGSGQGFRDCRPYQVDHLVPAQRASKAQAARAIEPTPLLEVCGDLSALEADVREACRRISRPDRARGGQATTAAQLEAEALLLRLAPDAHLMRLTLREGGTDGGVTEYHLPEGNRPERDIPYRFLVLLALARSMGVSLPADDASLRAMFPEIAADADKRGVPLAQYFKDRVLWKLKQRGFGRLFERDGRALRHMRIDPAADRSGYRMELVEMSLAVRLRL